MPGLLSYTRIHTQGTHTYTLHAQVWENLQASAIKYHVADNYNGTFLTMWSTGGIVFGIINIVSPMLHAAPFLGYDTVTVFHHGIYKNYFWHSCIVYSSVTGLLGTKL
jgi:hypothetical protein